MPREIICLTLRTVICRDAMSHGIGTHCHGDCGFDIWKFQNERTDFFFSPFFFVDREIIAVDREAGDYALISGDSRRDRET